MEVQPDSLCSTSGIHVLEDVEEDRLLEVRGGGLKDRAEKLVHDVGSEVHEMVSEVRGVVLEVHEMVLEVRDVVLEVHGVVLEDIVVEL